MVVGRGGGGGGGEGGWKLGEPSKTISKNVDPFYKMNLDLLGLF